MRLQLGWPNSCFPGLLSPSSPEKMHILLTADTVGGVWSYALDLMRALPAHQFTLATMGKAPSSAQCAQVARLANATLRASTWKLEWMEDAWDDVARAGTWLLELERDLGPDIVHLNGLAHGALPFAAPKIVVGHSCVGSWFHAVQAQEAPASWNCYREKARAGLRAADVVVAPTRALLSELQLLYGPFANARAIWNGAGLAPSSKQSLATRLEEGASPASADKEPFILAAGRVWDEAKNIALLDQIAPGVNWPIRVAGEISLQDGAAFEARHVELLGFVAGQEWRELRARAAIWAHPARYEPFGLAVLEAAWSGCALVLSDIPTLRELWQDAALFVAPGDAAGWTRALNQLSRNGPSRADLSGKARARAQRYSLEKFGANYDALYRELL